MSPVDHTTLVSSVPTAPCGRGVGVRGDSLVVTPSLRTLRVKCSWMRKQWRLKWPRTTALLYYRLENKLLQFFIQNRINGTQLFHVTPGFLVDSSGAFVLMLQIFIHFLCHAPHHINTTGDLLFWTSFQVSFFLPMLLRFRVFAT